MTTSFFWQPRAETALYRVAASGAARALASLGVVRSVYARRSVASGEVVLGKSDIDLHVIIAPFDDPVEEARALAVLARRIRRLRQILPILGDCDVSTPADLELWYRGRPGNWHRDRGWLRLWGESLERPFLEEKIDPASIVRWFLIAAHRLPGLVRHRSAHHCASVAADLLQAHYLIRDGHCDEVLRADILERWRREDPVDTRRAELAAGYASAFRKPAHGVETVAQTLALVLGDALAANLGLAEEGPNAASEVVSRVPFGFEERRYLLPDPRSPEDMRLALDELRRDPRVGLTTLGTLALQLRYWQPWEWHCLSSANPTLPLNPPRDEDYLATVRFSLHKEFPRRAGLDPARAVETELRLAQSKLYLDEGRVAASREDLCAVYESIYGHSPSDAPASLEAYFTHRYPSSARLIDELRAHPRLH